MSTEGIWAVESVNWGSIERKAEAVCRRDVFWWVSSSSVAFHRETFSCLFLF